MTRRSRWLLLLVALPLAILLVGGSALLLWWASRSRLPAPGSPRYEEMVSAFSSGVAALDTDANPIARDSLNRAVGIVPEEPAAWADLGLALLRLGDLDASAKALDEALKLAPDNAAIEYLLGLLEDRRGDFDGVVAHMKRAAELDPKDLRSRYALVKEYERQRTSDALALRTLEEIVALAPDNLAARIDLARLAAKSGDAERLASATKALGERAASWPEPARQQFDALQKAIGGNNPRLATSRVLVLRNLLVTVPAFRQGIAALELPAGTVGEPISRFLRLPNPSPSPAPPDEALKYSIEPAGKGEAKRADLVAVLIDPKDGSANLLEADGREVRRASDGGEIGAFPGGAAGSSPSRHGIAVADWNSDYAADLVLAGAGGVRFLKRKPDGSFEDATDATRLPRDVLDANAFGVWMADVEMDGDLDLVLGMRSGPTLVLLNHGDGSFEVSRPFDRVANARAFAWADLDRDGTPDAALLDDRGTLTVLDNLRAGKFRARAVLDGLGPKEAVTVADLDGDGAMELLLLGPGAIHRVTDRDEGRALGVSEVVRWDEGDPPQRRPGSLVGQVTLFAADLDNNGALDLVAARNGTRLWLGDGSGTFRPVTTPPDFQAFGVADLNNDGRLDLAGLSSEGKAVRALGAGEKSYGWLDVRPRAARAEGDGRINSFGVGGEIQVRAGLLVQTQVIAGPVVHFGLGTHKTADVARIVWPNGTMQAEFNPKANTAIAAEQRLKGSCPFIYAYDGSEVRFVTDFLWRSPLGLRINAQDTAGVGQTEDWIKIRGDQLAPRDGYYDLRLTAELWETHFWDHVSLMVVDHPRDTEVFVDERFARKPPTLKVHATKGRRPVASARDDRGRDVLELVRKRDGRYLDTFGRGSYQGVTHDHWVEVEIGDDVPRDRKLVLVGEGWIHPTDSSINVALGQGAHEPPRGLSLEAAEADGTWRVVRDDLGFPAGKNKTILVDLEGVFRPDAPRKLRLRTNLEVYWDALSVAEADDGAPLKTQKIAPTTANLRHRGYSRMTQADASSPEVPRYDILEGGRQRWNDLIGLYTRFGDVRELLGRVDDRYVIANAGDEVVLLFPAGGPPPKGWTRDFVLIGDGWNKDGDYNTAYSKTVLPLPSHDQRSYDTPPGDLEDDPVYRAHAGDWQQYHTRYVTPHVFREGLRPGAAARP